METESPNHTSNHKYSMATIQELESFKLSDAVKFHKELNPRLWDNEKLDPEVRDQLLLIAEDFVEYLGLDNLKVEDVTISGSNAAYSYTPHSDLDLHILVDFNKLPNDPVYQELFTAKKTLYNDAHDITVREVPVELYVQDTNQVHTSLGEYSVVHDKWIRIPKKRRANFDEPATKLKYEKLGDLIELALKSRDLKRVKDTLDIIKRYRKSGLEKAGEFGPENLAFRAIRKQGLIQDLYDLKAELHGEKLSIDEDAGSIADTIKSKLGLKQFIVTERGDDLILDSLIVGKENQGKGLGTTAMKQLIDYADQNGKRIILTPGVQDKTHGTTSRSRLVKFYKSLGFKENKGRSIDYAMGAGKMYRDPAKSINEYKEDLKSYKNPSPKTLYNLTNRSAHKHMRGMYHEGNTYWWDANDAIHKDGADALGIPYDYLNRLEAAIDKISDNYYVGGDDGVPTKIIQRYDVEELAESTNTLMYHVTPTRNLRSIMKQGLTPRIGDRSAKMAGEESGIFLFPTLDDAESAVSSWLGDEFDEDEELSLLAIDVSGLSLADSEAGYEKIAKSAISPDRISVSNELMLESSGYIPSAKEKNDPRFKMALTVDVKSNSIKKNAKAFGFKTSRAGIPPQARADGKITESKRSIVESLITEYTKNRTVTSGELVSNLAKVFGDWKPAISVMEKIHERHGDTFLMENTIDDSIRRSLEIMVNYYSDPNPIIGNEYIPVMCLMTGPSVMFFDILTNNPAITPATFGTLEYVGNDHVILNVSGKSIKYPNDQSTKLSYVTVMLVNSAEKYDRLRTEVMMKYEQSLPPLVEQQDLGESLMREWKSFLAEDEQQELFPGYDEKHKRERLNVWLGKSHTMAGKKPKVLYHVTPTKNLRSIMKQGLTPRVGDRSANLDGEESGIFLFPTLNDVDSAVSSWLGDEFDEDEELSLLAVDVSGLPLVDSAAGYEKIAKTKINPDRISLSNELMLESLVNKTKNALKLSASYNTIYVCEGIHYSNDILLEQRLYENFLNSATQFLGQKANQTMANVKGQINDTINAGIVIKDIISNPQLLTNTTSQIRKWTSQLIKNVNTKIQQIGQQLNAPQLTEKLIAVWKFISKKVAEFGSSDGWKGFLGSLGLYGFVKFINELLQNLSTLKSTIASGALDALMDNARELGSSVLGNITMPGFLAIFDKLTTVKKYFLDVLTQVKDKFGSINVPGTAQFSKGVQLEASGYIPSAKEKNDPRFKTALTVDVKPDAIKKNAKAFNWKTSRAGIPPQANPSGKLAEDLMREFKSFLLEDKQPRVGYHVTATKNLPVIQKNGIKADKRGNSYVWDSLEMAEWFADFQNDEGQDRTILKIDMTGIDARPDPEAEDMSEWSSRFQPGTNGGAWMVSGSIPPDKIIG